MSNETRTTSTGTVIGFGFIILGILNLFATLNHSQANLISSKRLPGILFILTGCIILLVKALKKTRQK